MGDTAPTKEGALPSGLWSHSRVISSFSLLWDLSQRGFSAKGSAGVGWGEAIFSDLGHSVERADDSVQAVHSRARVSEFIRPLQPEAWSELPCMRENICERTKSWIAGHLLLRLRVMAAHLKTLCLSLYCDHEQAASAFLWKQGSRLYDVLSHHSSCFCVILNWEINPDSAFAARFPRTITGKYRSCN